VLKDGIRFLRVIFTAAFLYRPQVIFNSIASFLLCISFLLMFHPISYYYSHLQVADWMIYRFIIAETFGLTAVVLFSSSFVLHNTVWLSLSNSIEKEKIHGSIVSFFKSKLTTFFALVLILVSVLLIWKSINTRLSTGHTNEHWSRYIAFSFLSITGCIILITQSLNWVFSLLKDKVNYIQTNTR